MINLENIRLRAIESSDSRFYYNWVNNAETNQWRGLYPPTSEAAAQKWVDDQAATTMTAEISDRFSLAVEIGPDTGCFEHVGFIGLRGICSRSRRAELWIYLGDKWAWNKGVGKEAVRGLCQFAFEEMNLHRLWLECDPEHQGGVRCYQKAGFVEEGRLRQAYFRRGQFRDTIMMGLLKPDWEARKTR